MNSTSVSVAEIPTALKTLVSHYMTKKEADKPTSNFRYDQGLNLIRGFLEFSSNHTVEELQTFTSQWVPRPPWVRVDDATIPSNYLDKAAAYLQAELGEDGLRAVGGRMWWQWRMPGSTLEAEWVEMKSDGLSGLERESASSRTPYLARRVMFYLHGGAYYFGGVNEHRYQMQRHARKLKARIFAPEYRLAPQFPFPCGLQDALAAYMFLLSSYDPGEIIFAGDSAGGALILSLLVLLRNQRLPLPSGAILLSPWVDLTHSFPSVCSDPSLDYVPSYGFHHKPSKAWPPPTYEEWLEMCQEAQCETGMEYANGGAHNQQTAPESDPAGTEPSPYNVSVEIGGEVFTVKEQIQMYAPNHLLAHPLVSPIMQPTLGGLPPIQIITGGAELLRDEQIYIAHKMANPQRYAPPNLCSDDLAQLVAYPPTLVQLQVWDHLCHVATTLSFTKPAKYMFRSIAQFGAWALNVRPDSSHTEPYHDILEAASILSRAETSTINNVEDGHVGRLKPIGRVGDAGDPLPPFVNSMIRQRVAANGDIYNLPPASAFAFCDPPEFDKIGKVKPIPLKRWLETREQFDEKYMKLRREIRREMIEDMRGGYIKHGDGENPPLSALAGRFLLNPIPRKSKLSKMNVLPIWSTWGSKNDGHLMQIRRKQEEVEAEERAARQRLRRQTSYGTHDADQSFMSHSWREEDKLILKEEEKERKRQDKERRKADKELERERRRTLRNQAQDNGDDDADIQSVMSSTKSSRFSTDTTGSSILANRAEKHGETREVVIPEDEEVNQDTNSLTPWETVPAPQPPAVVTKSKPVPATITQQKLTTHNLMPWEAYNADAPLPLPLPLPLPEPNVQIKVEVTKRQNTDSIESDLWDGYAAPVYHPSPPPPKTLSKITESRSPAPSIYNEVPFVVVPEKPKDETTSDRILSLTPLEQELWSSYAAPNYNHVPPPPPPPPPLLKKELCKIPDQPLKKLVAFAVHNLPAATPPPTAKLPPLPTPTASSRPPLSWSTSSTCFPAPTPPPATSALPPPPPPTGPLPPLPKGAFPPPTSPLSSPSIGISRAPLRTKSIERKTPIPLNLVQALHNNVRPVKEEVEEEEKQARLDDIKGRTPLTQREADVEVDELAPMIFPVALEHFLPPKNGTPILQSLNNTPAPPSIKDQPLSSYKSQDSKKWAEIQGVADESDLAIAPWDIMPCSASVMSGISGGMHHDRSCAETASITGQSIGSSAPSENNSIPLSRKTTATGARILKNSKRWEEIQGVADESFISPIPWEMNSAIPAKEKGREEEKEEKQPSPSLSPSPSPSPPPPPPPEKKRRWKWGRSSTKSNQDFGLNSVGSVSSSSRPSDSDVMSVYSGLQSPTGTTMTSAQLSSTWSKFPGVVEGGGGAGATAATAAAGGAAGGAAGAAAAAAGGGGGGVAETAKGKSQVDILIEDRKRREEEKAANGQVETGVVGKRPMLGGISLPFSLGKPASSESMVTLHSDDEENK